MKLRFLSVLLIFALLCGCTRATPSSAATTYSPMELVFGVAAHHELVGTTPLSHEDLVLWLTEFYLLPEDSWEDAAIFRATGEATEIAVIRLTGTVPGEEILSLLDAYKQARVGDFFGYDPEQTAIAEAGRTVLSDDGYYAALLICPQSWQVEEILLSILRGELPITPTPKPAPSSLAETPNMTPQPVSTPGPITTPEPTSPITHMMEIYDSSAILAAWDSGDSSALSDYDRAIYDRCREILSDILKDGMSDYEKESAIYQWIVRHVAYDYDHYDKLEGASLNSSTPYNPLINGKGICMGFASTFQLLADLAGLESIIIPGQAFNRREDHAWNMIRLNGQWYCVDATWDIGSGNPRFWSYFNVTSQYMRNTDHQWDHDAYPAATATDGGIH